MKPALDVKWFLGFVGSSILILGMMACGGGSETVKIGLLTPQTGPIAQYAPGFADAAKVAISELNVTHEGDFEFELIVGDSGCDRDVNLALLFVVVVQILIL